LEEVKSDHHRIVYAESLEQATKAYVSACSSSSHKSNMAASMSSRTWNGQPAPPFACSARERQSFAWRPA
jgi:hypothetical protein